MFLATNRLFFVDHMPHDTLSVRASSLVRVRAPVEPVWRQVHCARVSAPVNRDSIYQQRTSPKVIDRSVRYGAEIFHT